MNTNEPFLAKMRDESPQTWIIFLLYRQKIFATYQAPKSISTFKKHIFWVFIYLEINTFRASLFICGI